MIDEINLKVEKHIAVSAERYLAIELQFRSVNARLKNIEAVLWSSAAGLIAGMVAIIHLLVQLKV
jgi:hypothetical protein